MGPSLFDRVFTVLLSVYTCRELKIVFCVHECSKRRFSNETEENPDLFTR